MPAFMEMMRKVIDDPAIEIVPRDEPTGVHFRPRHSRIDTDAYQLHRSPAFKKHLAAHNCTDDEHRCNGHGVPARQRASSARESERWLTWRMRREGYGARTAIRKRILEEAVLQALALLLGSSDKHSGRKENNPCQTTQATSPPAFFRQFTGLAQTNSGSWRLPDRRHEIPAESLTIALEVC